MTLIQSPPRAASSPAPERDRSIDLVRAACISLVVLLHAMMVGVTVSGGEPVFANALEESWFAPVSWFVQMMPLFFVAGGFTAIGSWRRARARGVSPAAFVAGRAARLMRPAAALFVAIAAGLGILLFAGVPADIVATAGWRISQPLWFLGVFVLVQALVPAMAAWHERRPALALGAPLAAAAAVDVIRFASGIDAVGFLNLALVWLFVQQLGFWLADGRLGELARRALPVSLLAIGGALALLLTTGWYSPDMYVNLNPPTLLLAVYGAGQALLLAAWAPRLRRIAARPRVAAIVDWLGARSMTVYLWHMPVLIGLAGLCVLGTLSGAIALPGLHSPAWWATRPLWLVAAAVGVAAVSAATARFDRRRDVERPGSTARAAAATALGVGCVAAMFVLGLGAATALVCAAAALGAAALAGDFPRGEERAGAIARGALARQAGTVTDTKGIRS